MESFSQRESVIYEHLYDDYSRELFILRKKFAERRGVDFLAVYNRAFGTKIPFPFEHLHNKRFAVYGCGVGGACLLSILKANNLFNNITALYDTNTALHGQSFYGLTCTSFDQTTFDASGAQYIVISAFSDVYFKAIRDFLISQGVGSKNIIRNYKSIMNIEDTYFDKIILDRFSTDEIFVDGGCFDGTSSINFLHRCPNAKGVIAFEPTAEMIPVIRERIDPLKLKLIEAAMWSEKCILRFSDKGKSEANLVSDLGNVEVQAESLDNIVTTDERVTYIKMDIEGAELNALKGCRDTILKDRPKLAISIYHNDYDYLEIPEYILSLVPEYKLYIRHYTTNYGDTVLYAVI